MEQGGDFGAELTFQQEVWDLRGKFAKRLEEDVGHVKDNRVVRLVETRRAFKEVSGVTLDFSSNARCVLGFDKIRVEKSARPELLERLTSMVKTVSRPLLRNPVVFLRKNAG
jgi:hypothetical protein